jgi:riboflavin synthase
LFTGIIEEVGIVVKLDSSRLTIGASKIMEGLKLGDSISVSGTCLTVVARNEIQFSVDLSPETIRRTYLGRLIDRELVNLERAVVVGERLGGHVVQGHSDTIGRITSRRQDGNSVILRISVPRKHMCYIVEKGFVAIDGVSLTVVDKGTSTFGLSVVPYTLANTNLMIKSTGDRINVEVDLLAKYVESLFPK